MRDFLESLVFGMSIGALLIFMAIIFVVYLMVVVGGIALLIYGMWCACSAVFNYYRAERKCFESGKLFFMNEVRLAGWRKAVPEIIGFCIHGEVFWMGDSVIQYVLFWIGKRIVGTVIVLLLAAVTMPVVMAIEAGVFLAGKVGSLRKPAQSEPELVG